MKLYRVCYRRAHAAPREAGGLLYIPRQGAGRIDSPDARYAVLYLGKSPAGACAEVFYRGRYRVHWTRDMLRALPTGDCRVLAWYDITDAAAICDLNDPREMLRQRLTPSRIMTRDRTVTQAWASAIFEQGAFSGIQWWSYCDAKWMTLGIWDQTTIGAYGFEELTLEHPAIKEAAETMEVRINPA